MVGSVSMGNSRILMTCGPPILRVVLGTLFITNGWPKLMNLSQTQGYFNMMGLPAELALLIGLLEVVGGLFLILGLLTRIAALLFALEMISAFVIVNTSNVVIFPEGYELGLLSIPILFMAISFSLIFTGPSRFSLEWNIIKRELVPGGKEILQALK
ncbi:MAG: DoxX family protein [Candidatus Nitrosocosmicus sp.]|nr:DoxX family protein [Candidatus Nitrosocosmicus sp.]MDN5867920.1 DoxX family protein [Candidatus Nitrosocosmicus sp.]